MAAEFPHLPTHPYQNAYSVYQYSTGELAWV
eukprot:CAMPEP_0203803336 /NCGR_PEP_ID=MMETSP0100_2-20121128/12770_1 /ASSEMBLY_ACC=CAM_ASM_000210 /TAXON_ID=96639 /ORGANISM=" , Strain NY0313808BC1" /LENGTH=30 /DNA_ID= /DNA_START= /DNA_END= /DNA_ORIENTATION=